jgi:phosphoribosylanthranilate isomerase
VGVGETLPVLPEGADYVLFDSGSEQRGGTGKTFDWNLLRDYSGLPYFLAGGLTAENIPKAIRSLAPLCADVSSGVETEGVKDAGKIHEFVRVARRLR